MKVIRSKIPIGMFVRVGGRFDPSCRKVEGTFLRDIVVREGGGLDP